MDKLYIIIPAYNEEENIKNVIKQWYPIVKKVGNDSKLLVIDDGSKDSTFDIISELAKDKEDLIALGKANSGHGATILNGYKNAIKNNADYIFQTDSDGQTLPEEFDDFWNVRKEYDMVIGNRLTREDGISRILVSKVLKLILYLIFAVNVLDANTPYRLIKAKTLNKYINIIPKDYNLTNVIISVIFTKKKRRVKFLPITFLPRQGGVNSINIPRIIKIGIEAIKNFVKINRSL